jgi:hypothetical protein
MGDTDVGIRTNQHSDAINEDCVSVSSERDRKVATSKKRSYDYDRNDDIDDECSDSLSTRSFGRSKKKKRRDDEKSGRRTDRDRRHEKKKKKRQHESDSSSSESRKHSKRCQKKSSKKQKKKHRKTDEKDSGGEIRRSVISGEKIQMKIDKTAEDLVQDQARKQLLDFMNSSYK